MGLLEYFLINFCSSLKITTNYHNPPKCTKCSTSTTNNPKLMVLGRLVSSWGFQHPNCASQIASIGNGIQLAPTSWSVHSTQPSPAHSPKKNNHKNSYE